MCRLNERPKCALRQFAGRRLFVSTNRASALVTAITP